MLADMRTSLRFGDAFTRAPTAADVFIVGGIGARAQVNEEPDRPEGRTRVVEFEDLSTVETPAFALLAKIGAPSIGTAAPKPHIAVGKAVDHMTLAELRATKEYGRLLRSCRHGEDGHARQAGNERTQHDPPSAPNCASAQATLATKAKAKRSLRAAS